MDWLGFESVISMSLQSSAVVTFHPKKVAEWLFDNPRVTEAEYHSKLLEFCNMFNLRCITVLGPKGPEAIRFWYPIELPQIMEELPDGEESNGEQDQTTGTTGDEVD